MRWGRKNPGRRERGLAREVEQLRADLAETQAELESEQRRTRVLQAEIETLAAVIARDRERIRAETAAYARQRAECEGMTDARRTD